MKRGCAFLQQQVTKGIEPSDGGIAGLADQVLWALVSAGKEADEAGARVLLQRVLAEEFTGTYQVAFQALDLARLDAKAHRARLAECARFLMEALLPSGMWSYGYDLKASGDRSNTAFALLFLDRATRSR